MASSRTVDENRWVTVPSTRVHGAAGQNRSRSITWAVKQGKLQPMGKCFFLTSTFIELHRTWQEDFLPDSEHPKARPTFQSGDPIARREKNTPRLLWSTQLIEAIVSCRNTPMCFFSTKNPSSAHRDLLGDTLVRGLLRNGVKSKRHRRRCEIASTA